jgi:hypothetical protein
MDMLSDVLLLFFNADLRSIDNALEAFHTAGTVMTLVHDSVSYMELVMSLDAPAEEFQQAAVLERTQVLVACVRLQPDLMLCFPMIPSNDGDKSISRTKVSVVQRLKISAVPLALFLGSLQNFNDNLAEPGESIQISSMGNLSAPS